MRFNIILIGLTAISSFHHYPFQTKQNLQPSNPLFQNSKFKTWESAPIKGGSKSTNDARRQGQFKAKGVQSGNKRMPQKSKPNQVVNIRINDQTPEENLDNFYSIKSFSDIGANSLALEALEALNISKPSKIQAVSYRSVLEGGNCAIAEQTGSGKTLAYLLPLIQRLKIEEENGTATRAKPNEPRVLILAPTAELTQQVHSVVRRVAAIMKLRTCCFTGGSGIKTQSNILKQGVDILVATPGRVISLLEEKSLNLINCSAIVLDEVDVLFLDETFKLAPIGTHAPNKTQFLFVTATLPVEVSEMIKAEFPGTKFLTGPGLHRVAPGVEEVLVDCSSPPDEVRNEQTGMARKKDALLTHLSRRKNALRTLIFCNTIKSCREVENVLRRTDRKESNFSLLAFHSAIEHKTAQSNLREFSRSNALKPMIMICTDRSSRGMDFESCPVDHVILYDFPRDPIEYMRRVGRTARAGRKGAVTVLAWGRQVSLAREIMAGNKLGKRLLSVEGG